MKNPRISVVMPVHNALPFLDASISSILEQTFADFELVILDDASTDGSDEVLREWQKRDDRVRLHQSDQKLGLVGSSNLVIAKACGAVIARMDADDVSHRDRLQRQWDVLQTYSDVVAVGTLCDGIDATGRIVRPRDRWRIVRSSRYVPFPHGSSMFRRTAFELLHGYDERFHAGEDQDLFYRMRSLGRVVTLPDVLYHYRYHSLNATLLTGAAGVRAASNGHSQNNDALAALYMWGSMRLWAGETPAILPQLISRHVLRSNWKSLLAIASALVGSVSPAALRFALRWFIRARDLMATIHVRDGRPYEWRLK
jgi:glycosyltransferase involved in cell wall biosynthesis